MMVLQEENSKDLVRKNMQDYLHMSINPLEMKHLMVIFTEVLVVKHLMGGVTSPTEKRCKAIVSIFK